MNKNIVILIMLIAFGQCIAAQTYYYRYTKSIIKGVTDTNVSGGQFITFDGKKCFESDKYGNNVGNGSMTYEVKVSRQTSLETYWGSCYWSPNAHMKFNTDKSHMEIETNAGKIYVYKRATPLAGVLTCSLIRANEKQSGGGGGSSYITPAYSNQPTYPQGEYDGGGTIHNGGNGSKTGSAPSRTKREKPQKTRHTCTLCNGSGTWIRNDGSVSLYGGKDYLVRCNICGYEHYRSSSHKHVNCPQCHGRGYKEY